MTKRPGEGDPLLGWGDKGARTLYEPCIYEFFTNVHVPLLKVAAQCRAKLVVRDLVGASWATIGADILQTMTPADVLAEFAGPRLCVHHGHPRRGKAARLAQRHENRKGEWSALPLESMSSVGTDHYSPRGG